MLLPLTFPVHILDPKKVCYIWPLRVINDKQVKYRDGHHKGENGAKNSKAERPGPPKVSLYQEQQPEEYYQVESYGDNRR